MIHCFVGLGALTYTWVSGITLFKSAVQGVQDGASAIEAATGAIEAATGATLAIAKRVDSVVGAVQAAVSAMKDTQELLAQSSQAPRYDNVVLQHIEDIGGVHCLAIGLAVGLAIGLLIGMFVASRIWAAATRSVLAKESAIGQASPATSPLATRATHQTTSAAPQATPSAAPQAPPATSPLASPTTHKAQTAAHQAQTAAGPQATPAAGPLVKPTAHQAQTAAGPLAPPASPQAQSDDGEASLQLFKPVLDPARVEARAARLGRAIRTLRRPCVANATSATLPVNSYDRGAASSLLKFGNTRNVRFGGNSGGQPHLPNANGKYTPRPDMELTSGNDANMRQELPDDESSLATDDEITMNVREFSDDDNDNDDYSRKSANSASSGDESSTEVVVPPTDNLDVYSDDWFDDTPTRGTENNSVGSESQDDEDNQAPLEESVERVENTGVVIPVIAVQPTEFATRAYFIDGRSAAPAPEPIVAKGHPTAEPNNAGRVSKPLPNTDPISPESETQAPQVILRSQGAVPTLEALPSANWNRYSPDFGSVGG
ncbi:hypothetical protein GGI14_000647, partial [Coemansia sp. S680]